MQLNPMTSQRGGRLLISEVLRTVFAFSVDLCSILGHVVLVVKLLAFEDLQNQRNGYEHCVKRVDYCC